MVIIYYKYGADSWWLTYPIPCVFGGPFMVSGHPFRGKDITVPPGAIALNTSRPRRRYDASDWGWVKLPITILGGFHQRSPLDGWFLSWKIWKSMNILLYPIHMHDLEIITKLLLIITHFRKPPYDWGYLKSSSYISAIPAMTCWVAAIG